MVLATTLRALQCSFDVPAKRIVFDLKVECWSPRSNGESHIRVAGLGLGKQQKMADTERASHDGVVPQSVGFAFLESSIRFKERKLMWQVNHTFKRTAV